jgi:hypothetical protein
MLIVQSRLLLVALVVIIMDTVRLVLAEVLAVAEWVADWVTEEAEAVAETQVGILHQKATQAVVDILIILTQAQVEAVVQQRLAHMVLAILVAVALLVALEQHQVFLEQV